MHEVITAIAQVIAIEAGAEFQVRPGVAYDAADRPLGIMAEALMRLAEQSGIDLLSLRRDGKRLIAELDDSAADEPLSPLAFATVVRRLSWDLLGEVWQGVIAPEASSHESAPAMGAAVRAA